MSASSSVQPRSKRAWRILVSLLAIETAAGLIAMIPLGTGFLGAGKDELGQRVSVLLAGLLAIAWVAATFVGALRSRASWVRGSALTLHVLMFAAGTGILQYRLAEGWVGWALILCAFVGFFSGLIARPEYADPAEIEDAAAEDPTV